MSYGLACASICTIFLVAKVVTVIDLYLNLAGPHYSAHYIFLLHAIHRSVGTAHAQLHIHQSPVMTADSDALNLSRPA